MMRKNIYAMMMITGILLTVTACGQKNAIAETSQTAVETTTAASTAADENAGIELPTSDFLVSPETEADMEGLLGMTGKPDADVKGMFGGGTENWTEDQSILIGLDYVTKLFGREAKIHTMYDDDLNVTTVQAELTGLSLEDGKKEIQNAIGAEFKTGDQGEGGHTGSEASYNGKNIMLYQVEDTLIIEMYTPVE